MARRLGPLITRSRSSLLLLVMFAIVTATIVETVAAADLGVFPEPADFMFTTLVIAIPVAGWSWVGSRASQRAGWLALTSGVVAAVAWSFHAAVVWAFARNITGAALSIIAWPAFWLPFLILLPLGYCVPLSGDKAVMAPWLRRFGRVAVISIAAVALAQAVSPGPIDGNYGGVVAVDNPFGIPSLAGAAAVATGLGFAAFLAFGVAGLIDGMRRYRRGRVDARGLGAVLVVFGSGLGAIMVLAIAAIVVAEVGFAALWALAVSGLTVLLVVIAARALSETARAERAEARNRMAAQVRAEERKILRRDLHDNVGPAVAAIGIQLDLLEAAVVDPDLVQGIGRARSAAASARSELRNIVEQLRPPLLDELGLLAALEARCAPLDHRAGGMRVRICHEGELDDLPDAVATAVIAVCGEAATNAARHSGGSNCNIELHRYRDLLEVRVGDDGRWGGGNQNGHGLSTMRERVEELGGTLEIVRSERGTEVSFSIELSR